MNATDADGLTALHHAISEGHGDAAVLLLKSGAEPDKRDSMDTLAIDLAPDLKVFFFPLSFWIFCFRGGGTDGSLGSDVYSANG